MLFPIYFSHGYREREISFNRHFAKLSKMMNFVLSLDPPSDDVNAAKLERHLKYTHGLVAVLSKRDDFLVSPYIMFEIRMCLKLGRPALVFIEDTLPDTIVPPTIFQKRFSTKSFKREVYEQMNSLEVFRKYTGEFHVPKYQVYSKQKSCLLVGFESLLPGIKKAVTGELNAKGYRILVPDSKSGVPLHNESHFEFLNLDLAVVVCDNLNAMDNYIFGALNSYQTPVILLTTDSNCRINMDLPVQFRPRLLSNKNIEEDLKIIYAQIELAEEDGILLEDTEQVDAYVDALASSYPQRVGNYSNTMRNEIITKVHHHYGDVYKGITDSTILNRSSARNSFNKLSEKEKNKDKE